MSDVIKLVQYFRNLDHFPYYSRVRKLFYPDQPPVSTVVQVSEMLPDTTVLIEVEATVWLPQPIQRLHSCSALSPFPELDGRGRPAG